MDNLEKRYNNVQNFKELHVYIFWGIWRARNLFIVENISQNVYVVSKKKLSSFRENYKEKDYIRHVTISAPTLSDGVVVGYFDGAAMLGNCGCGMYIILNDSHIFKF